MINYNYPDGAKTAALPSLNPRPKIRPKTSTAQRKYAPKRDTGCDLCPSTTQPGVRICNTIKYLTKIPSTKGILTTAKDISSHQSTSHTEVLQLLNPLMGFFLPPHSLEPGFIRGIRCFIRGRVLYPLSGFPHLYWDWSLPPATGHISFWTRILIMLMKMMKFTCRGQKGRWVGAAQFPWQRPYPLGQSFTFIWLFSSTIQLAAKALNISSSRSHSAEFKAGPTTSAGICQHLRVPRCGHFHVTRCKGCWELRK